MCDASNPIFSIFYTVFGGLLKVCNSISGNYYIIALFIFTLIVKIVLFPLSIKQQKSSVKMGKLRPKEMIIREKYKGRKDRATQQKMNMEVQELYRKEGYSPYSGCLPLLIQLPIIIILFGVIRMPLTYTTSTNIDVNSQYKTAVQILDGAVSAVRESGLIDIIDNNGNNNNNGSGDVSEEEETTSNRDTQQTAAIVGLAGGSGETDISPDETRDTLKAFEEDYVKLMELFGAKVTDGRWDGNDFTGKTNYEFNLTEFIVYDYRDKIIDDLIKVGVDEEIVYKNIPAELDFNKDFVGSIPKFTYFGKMTLLDTPGQNGLSTLLLIPLLVFLTSFYSGVVTKKLSVQPATADGVQPGGGFMKWGLPLFTTYIAWAFFPAAIGVYWIYTTVLGVGQTFLLARMYPIPTVTEEEVAELKKQLKAKRKKVITIEVDEDDDTYDNLIIKSGDKKSPGTKYEMLSSDEPSPSGRLEKAMLKPDEKREAGGKKGLDGDADSDFGSGNDSEKDNK